jgi:hypothetical protein
MKTIKFKSWNDFASRVLMKYAAESSMVRQQLIFRGQADSRWKLEASLDRGRSFPTSFARQDCLRRLIGQFRNQALSLRPRTHIRETLDWELFGRHHGLPTSVLDFTASPFVAAYFAFWESSPTDATHATVWRLDRQVFEEKDLDQVAILDEEEKIRFNPRAHEQRGLFLQIKDVSKGIEDALGSYLVRYDIPISQHKIALAALDSMSVNARNLFRDLDGAARTAALRVLLLEDE